jgi:hypothetical protein
MLTTVFEILPAGAKVMNCTGITYLGAVCKKFRGEHNSVPSSANGTQAEEAVHRESCQDPLQKLLSQVTP